MHMIDQAKKKRNKLEWEIIKLIRVFEIETRLSVEAITIDTPKDAPFSYVKIKVLLNRDIDKKERGVEK